eukprot:349990-Chlamydomonas_euryale.AAC.9
MKLPCPCAASRRQAPALQGGRTIPPLCKAGAPYLGGRALGNRLEDGARQQPAQACDNLIDVQVALQVGATPRRPPGVEEGTGTPRGVPARPTGVEEGTGTGRGSHAKRERCARDCQRQRRAHSCAGGCLWQGAACARGYSLGGTACAPGCSDVAMTSAP